MSALVAAAFWSAALACSSELDRRFVVRPKSVMSWLTVAPAAARGKITGLFSAPAATRLPASESTPVRLRYAVGSNAERVSRTYWRGPQGRRLPMVICGLLGRAGGSGCCWGSGGCGGWWWWLGGCGGDGGGG